MIKLFKKNNKSKEVDMEKLRVSLDNQFFINKQRKMIVYQSFRYNEKHKNYEFYNKYEKIKLGVQLCDFINTDFHSFTSSKAFIDKYSVVAIAELSKVPIYRYYAEDEYIDMIKNVINHSVNDLEKYQKAFIEDIKYIYNLNDLEELNNLTPAQRLHILKESKKTSHALKIYDDSKIKLSFYNFGNFARKFHS